MSGELYLILHRVRGEPAFDIAAQLDNAWSGDAAWIIPTSGHRAYPYRWWPLEDLADVSDINNSGFHERPSALDHTVPADWPDHYRVEPLRLKANTPIKATIEGRPIEFSLTDEELAALRELGL